MSGEDFELKIRRVEPGTYEIQLRGEDDTIGNLLATYLELSEGIQLSYYTRPHPLRDEIVLYVKLEDPDADIKSVLERVLGEVLRDLEEAKRQYLEALRRSGVSVEDLE